VAHVTFTVARKAPRFAVSQILFGLVDFKFKVSALGGSIPGVCLAEVLYWASVSGCWVVKCHVDSAGSRIVSVNFWLFMYESGI